MDVEHCSFFGGTYHHGRAMMMVSISLICATAFRFRWWMPLIVAEIVLLAPRPVVLESTQKFDTQALYELKETKTVGRVIFWPAFGPGVPFQRGLWIQSIHQKPVFLHPNRPDIIIRSSNSLIHFLRKKEKHPIWSKDISAVIIDKKQAEEAHVMMTKAFGAPHFSDASFSIWKKAKD